MLMVYHYSEHHVKGSDLTFGRRKCWSEQGGGSKRPGINIIHSVHDDDNLGIGRPRFRPYPHLRS